MRTAIEALSDIISTSPTSDQGMKRDDKVQMSDAFETPSAVTPTPLESEKDEEQEYLDPMRNVSKALSATTSTSFATEQDAKDGAVPMSNAVGTSTVTPKPHAPGQVAQSDYAAHAMLFCPADAVKSLESTRGEEDNYWDKSIKKISRMKNYVYDRMTTAEVVRQLTNG
jgi:hypothetical protein